MKYLHVRSFTVLLILFLWGGCISLRAQDSVWLHVTANNNRDAEKLVSKQDVFFAEENAWHAYLDNMLPHLYEKGYLLASWSPVALSHDTLYCNLDAGRKIFWAQLSPGNTDRVFLNGAGFREKDFSGKIYRQEEVVALFGQLLHFAEDHGYPFASVHLDSIAWQDSVLSARLEFDKNRLFTFDTLRVEGNLKLSDNYLRKYTGIEPGAIYNQSLLNDLDARLQEILFARETQPARLAFSGDKAQVILYLDAKKSSKFDFIIGVLPNHEIAGRLVITGEGTLDLQNALGQGELIHLYFSKLESTTKSLETSFAYPYLPHLPLGADASFSLYLKDSSYLERKASLGIIYQFIGNNNIRIFSSFYNNSVLTFDTASVIASHTLPANLDVAINSYGIAWNFEKLNYRYNPRKGYAVNLSGTAGTKKIKENNTLLGLSDPADPEFDFATLYDSIANKSLNITYAYNFRYFIPIFRHNTILLQVQGAALINDHIFSNEVYRIGGSRLLRGFDEEVIPASQYHIGTVEIRYLLSQNSYASLFFDGGYVEDASVHPAVTDFPVGFGAGVQFETKAGIFGIDYALGSRMGNPVQIRDSKIHFGYVNYF